MVNYKLKIKNASQLVVVSKNKPYLVGKDMSNVEIIENGSLIVDSNGIIIDIGTEQEILDRHRDDSFDTVIDCQGRAVIPGLVDGHTHPVYAGDRVHEFAMKLAGATYLEVQKAGGGIGFTVQHTRQASESDLFNLLKPRLDRMLKQGTTLIEAKSGYGLETDTEMKMLKVLHRAAQSHAIEISATYLGGHAIPKGSTAEQATEDIVNKQLPELKRLRDAGEISPENIDVFLERGFFEYDDTKRILEAGQQLGLAINFHGDELSFMKSGELAGELKARAISHLEKVSEEGMLEMAKVPTFAVLLPTTAYVLRLECPPARRMIELNVPVALGSDYNPNAHCLSMPFVMNLACVLMKMNMNEALVAATINSAASINKSKTHGSLEIGKYADMVIIDSNRWEHIIYEMVDPPISHVIKKGSVVFQQQQQQ
ncbi:imidazolonepropionase [Heterostelium album PN500]|uniref:Probable imidazolonepropionase n=1 Tax=Heterostelium pallidum (strain ATCC 26659 / Pp 5 / PN500) TaxID=670386 RepID=D3BB71_HETP5|nr:imidazolonepropionase [Heterostelium album PN500]EFA81808.1 imidazolonepropionase [Heterostelium album PN500]|eukprot:XP_020433925.1 imidazolonepropionase [Heterostelium album PN500]